VSAETTVTLKTGPSGYQQTPSWNLGGTIIKQGTSATESTIAAPLPVEPVDPEVRTFADIENGDPDAFLDEIVLDAAII
jgi:hypothetical protein